MGIIKEIFSELGYTTVIPFLILFIKRGIDTFNMTGIERALLTDSKKIINQLSQISIISLFFSIILFLSELTGNDEDKFITSNNMLTVFFLTFILILFLISILYFVFFIFVNYFSFKVIYLIQGDSDEGNRKIIRRVNKEKLLVSDSKNLQSFIDMSIFWDKKISSDIDKAKLNKKEWVHQSNGSSPVFHIISIILSVIAIVVNFKEPEFIPEVIYKYHLLAAIPVCIIYFLVLHYVIVKNNDRMLNSIKTKVD